ncbi:platelet-derived growth factor subunit A isoform X2 [Lutzomyia longipalpis]|uniref:Platelet-derived growth factor (PDGF) family profile domain-containing protein n=2 Tax=Lutzomyia longipalpis TaxID=7200 RepID=A0A1B0CGF3_LUTLO|nr:platelet-derived growth factor subunit A isoform X2 [Lutzomyia longipalpis]XP_055682726.1 platelet-derived growth factor subunit A isoform X2 [Lutzomyia longipalpis]XP_055682727.1 platelet-derived growth factor subunit A isoform X2 [Lutzomyia longipalpis]
MWNFLLAISTSVTFLATTTTGDHAAFPLAPKVTVKRRSAYDPIFDVPLSVSDDAMEIPIDLIYKMSSVGNITQFVDQFIDKDSVDPREFPGNFDGEGIERGIGVIPKPGICTPELTLVSLIPTEAPNDPSIVYYPQCTRVKRCGGCCSHRLLSCQPTETETLTYTIVKSQYTGGVRMQLVERVPIIVEQHTKCRCACAVKEEHCNRFQRYEASQCKCVCTNLEDQSKCLKESELKIWDSNACNCRCRETKGCTTGTFFDETQCQCIPLPILRPSDEAILDRKKYIIKARPVTPNDDSRYHTVTPEYSSGTPWPPNKYY